MWQCRVTFLVSPYTGEMVLFDRYRIGLSVHWMTHVFLTPHRWICSTEVMGVEYCAKRETYNAEGFSHWAEAPLTMWKMHVAKSTPVLTKMMALAYLLTWFCLALILYGLQQVGWKHVLAVLMGSFVYHMLVTKKKRNIKSA